MLIYSDFQIFDGHNGNAAAIFTKEQLLNHVLAAIPRGLGREEWLQALPRALVAGFVKTDKDFQSRGMKFGISFNFHVFFLVGNHNISRLMMTYCLQERLLELQ